MPPEWNSGHLVLIWYNENMHSDNAILHISSTSILNYRYAKGTCRIHSLFCSTYHLLNIPVGMMGQIYLITPTRSLSTLLTSLAQLSPPLFSTPDPKAQVHLSVVRPSSLTFHIFDFSSERNLTKLWQEAKSQRPLPSLCFWADRENKMDIPGSD